MNDDLYYFGYIKVFYYNKNKCFLLHIKIFYSKSYNNTDTDKIKTWKKE